MPDKDRLLILLSMVIWGSVGIFRRSIPIASELLAFTRGVIGSLFLILFVKAKGQKLFQPVAEKDLGLLVLSGAVMGINWLLLFEAYNYTSVSAATLCYYMQPSILILLSPLFFKEKLTVRKLLCAALALLGMVFVSGVMETGFTDIGELKGVLLALGAALIYAFVVILNKKLPGIDAYEKTVIQLLSSGAVMVPYLLLRHSFHVSGLTPLSLGLVIFVGIVHTGIAYALYFGSVNHVPAQTVAILSYVDPLSALLLSALILGERMSLLSVIGTVLILGSAYMAERQTS